MYEAYVIGTAPNEMLYFIMDNAGFVREVLWGWNDLHPRCILYDLEEAKDILADIQENFEKLEIRSLIGEARSVKDLRIYQLGTVKEVE